MSVFWYVDERSRPQRFEANVWLIFVPRPGLWLPPTLASTIRRGLTYWNQRRDQTLSASGRPVEIRYRLRLRHAVGTEVNPPGLQDALRGGHHARRMEDWVQHHRPAYESGFAVILYASEGMGRGRSEAKRSIAHYTMAGAGSDLRGGYTLAHELGHILGLRDRYYEADTDPTPGDGTRSHEGYAGNLMGDLDADRVFCPRPWVGPAQLRGMMEAAVTAAGPSRRATHNDADYFGAPWALKESVVRPR